MNNQHTRRGYTQEGVYKNCHSKSGHYLWPRPVMFLYGVLESHHFLLNKVRSRIKYGMTALFDNNGCVGDAEQKLLSIHLFNKEAFTLIELLVVVLIIGILAAVALPQYQLAVAKSRFAKLYNLTMTYERVIQEYELANGSYPTRFDDLAIGRPAGTVMVNLHSYSCVKNDEFFCCLIPQAQGISQAINCGDSDNNLIFHYMNNANKQYCVAKNTHAVSTKLCKKLGNATFGWATITPNGLQSGYMYYGMN